MISREYSQLQSRNEVINKENLHKHAKFNFALNQISYCFTYSYTTVKSI